MIVRTPRPDTGYTVLANDVIRDARLSWRARGLLVYILSLPDNWRTNSVQLARAGREGRDAVRTALDELAQLGYLIRVRRQDDAGRWATITYVFDRPQDDTEQLALTLGITTAPTPKNPAPDSQSLYEVPTSEYLEGYVSTRVPSRTPALCGSCNGFGHVLDETETDVVRCAACSGGMVAP